MDTSEIIDSHLSRLGKAITVSLAIVFVLLRYGFRVQDDPDKIVDSETELFGLSISPVTVFLFVGALLWLNGAVAHSFKKIRLEIDDTPDDQAEEEVKAALDNNGRLFNPFHGARVGPGDAFSLVCQLNSVFLISLILGVFALLPTTAIAFAESLPFWGRGLLVGPPITLWLLLLYRIWLVEGRLMPEALACVRILIAFILAIIPSILVDGLLFPEPFSG